MIIIVFAILLGSIIANTKDCKNYLEPQDVLVDTSLTAQKGSLSEKILTEVLNETFIVDHPEAPSKKVLPTSVEIWDPIEFTKPNIADMDVETPRAFELQTTPVTRFQYFEIMGELPEKLVNFYGPEAIRYGNLPVTNFTHDELRRFFSALSGISKEANKEFLKIIPDHKPDYIYRLPTKEEWASIASKVLYDAGRPNTFYAGANYFMRVNNLLNQTSRDFFHKYGNYASSSRRSVIMDIKSKAGINFEGSRTLFGLFGNVWELVLRTDFFDGDAVTKWKEGSFFSTGHSEWMMMGSSFEEDPSQFNELFSIVKEIDPSAAFKYPSPIGIRLVRSK